MSEVKVNKISPRTACGTVTLGDSGDTFTIPSGATITNNGTAAGFGATGAASWDTTVKTSGFTAVSGVGYFVNTTAGAITVNLPAGVAGAVVAIKDYANTFDTYAVTLVQNGSDKIGGSTVNATLSTEGLAVTLVFVDATQGWLVTDNGTQDTAPTAQYVTATGGTITTCGNFKIHSFTGPGTFTVCSTGNAEGSTSVDYMVIAGGGGGGTTGPNGYSATGAAGAGGYRESPGTASGSYTVSPLGVSPAVALPVSIQGYPITVGAGGAGAPVTPQGTPGVNGNPSTFSTITSTGGGNGGGPACSGGSTGGSGGGASNLGSPSCGGAGNTPPVSPPQGNNGGNGIGGGSDGGAGGGGAGAVGTNIASDAGAVGGAGVSSGITGSTIQRAGGGSGGSYSIPGDITGGAGGGGTGGGNVDNTSSSAGGNGTSNTGGGGGAGGGTSGVPVAGLGGAGGSGIVIIRYKFQN